MSARVSAPCQGADEHDTVPATSPAESPAIDYKALVQDDRIHASLYTDPRIFADEMDRIFHEGWVFVGHDSEIPGAGDFVTRTLGREPVIMVRGQDGGVAVLVNRCMHRGTMLCPADRGSVRTFACPYHGWTYDLAGTLLGVPYPGGYASFDKRAHGLARAPRVASYRGFVFASLRAAGPTLAEHLGAATRLIDRSCDLAPDGEVALTAGWVKHRCAANWKMLPENDSDGYHLGFVHSAPASTPASSCCRPGRATARSRPRSCAGSSPTSRSRRRTASSSPGRTSSWPSCPSRPSTRCTGGRAGPRIACAGWTARCG